MTIAIPAKKPEFVKTTHYTYIERTIANERFKPVLLTGPTGTGKSMNVEQACANLGKPMIKFSVTKETSKEDLMGGLRLTDGSTNFEYGPVTQAMREGAVVVLDEFDCAHANSIMCLQSVMEGNGYHIDTINETIIPEKGFQIFLTANTKGMGDDTGLYIGTQYLNEAFLERIAAVLEFDYMSKEDEEASFKEFVKSRKIDLSAYTSFDPLDRIAEYATAVRDSQKSGGGVSNDHTLSSRRLKFLIEEMESSNGSVVRAMRMTFARFDTPFKDALIDFYTAKYEDDSGDEVISDDLSDISNYKFYRRLAAKNANK